MPRGLGFGALEVELGLGRRWGLGLRGQGGSLLRGSRTDGAVWLHRAPVTLYGRFALQDPERSGFAFRVGLFLDVLSAQASGFPTAGSETLLDGGAWFAATGELVLKRHWLLHLGLGGSVLFRTTTLVVANAGTLVSTPRGWIELWAGVGWRFF